MSTRSRRQMNNPRSLRLVASLTALVALLCANSCEAFVPSTTVPGGRSIAATSIATATTTTTTRPCTFFALQSTSSPSTVSSSSVGENDDDNKQDDDDDDDNTVSLEILDAAAATDEWELDCYSRPVVVPETGKKLWEVLVTDSAGSFQYRHVLPSNQVNSKTLRGIVEDLMDQVETKPTIIRFFRGAMFNMMNIALSDIAEVSAKPSRCTLALASWLEERHRTVYPQMAGYNKNMVTSSATPSFLNVRTPIKLPDALRGEKYAFVSLPLAEFLPNNNNNNDGGVNAETIGVGKLCQVPSDLPGDAFVQGVVVLSNRAKALASWLAGTEVVSLTADLRKRVLLMETDIDTEFLLAKLNDEQRAEAAALEEGKQTLQGLHFLCVQEEDDDAEPEGFWLLRDIPAGI